MPISWKTHTERVCIRHQDVEGVAYKWQGGFPLSVERIRTASYKILGCFENVRLKFSGGKKRFITCTSQYSRLELLPKGEKSSTNTEGFYTKIGSKNKSN